MATLHLLCDFLIQRTSFFWLMTRFFVIKKSPSEAQLFLQLCFLHKPNNGNNSFKQQTVEQPY